MCLAILKPAKVSITEDRLRNGWIANPDGAGYAFVHKGKVVTKKGYTKLQDFLTDIEADFKKHKNSHFAIHFRIRSSGEKSPEMTHPFPVAGGVVIHNGSITGTGAEYGTGESDTCKFANKFKENLTFDFVVNHKADLNEAMGKWNKLVFLYDTGQYVIINDNEGVWDGDVWFSNHTFKPRPTGIYSSDMYE